MSGGKALILGVPYLCDAMYIAAGVGCVIGPAQYSLLGDSDLFRPREWEYWPRTSELPAP